MTSDKSEINIYQTEDGHTKIDVHLEKETVWLTQTQMSELFQTTKQNTSLHINNAFKEGEIDPTSVVKEYLTAQNEFSIEDHTIGCADAGRTTKSSNVFMENNKITSRLIQSIGAPKLVL